MEIWGDRELKVFFTPHVEHYTRGLVGQLMAQGVNVSIRQPPSTPVLRKLARPFVMNPFSFFDAYHFNSSIEGALHRNKERMIVTEHGFPSEGPENEEVRKARREAKALLSVNSFGVPIYTISNYSADMLRERWGVKVREVIYHGVLPQFLASVPRPGRTAPAVLLFNSRLIQMKRPLLFLEGLALMHSDFRAVIFPSGPQRFQVAQKIAELNLGDRVSFRKQVPFDELQEVYRQASIYVHTSPTEPFGFTILEAMASGVPIVVPDEGGAHEVAGKAGVRFRADDAISLAEAVDSLIQDQEAYTHQSELGLLRAREFNWEKAAQRYLEAYSKCIL